MSLNEVRNVVLLLSNPFTGGQVVPSQIVQDVAEVSPDFDNSVASLVGNMTTLSIAAAPIADGAMIEGLLFVPDLDSMDPCSTLANQYVPQNVTRQNNLPPTNYNLIALAPWISPSCAESYLAAARKNSVRAMLTYIPSHNISQPPPASDPIWKVPGGDGWKTDNRHPVYAVSGAWGSAMMAQLSLYSGNLTQVPYGAEISAVLDPDPQDYVRVWTQLTVQRPPDSIDLWVFMLIVLGVIIFIVGGITVGLTCVRQCRQEGLRRRVMRGEVNLEARGIKRLRVPLEHVRGFPLFLYDYEEPDVCKSPTKSSVRGAYHYRDFIPSLDYQPRCQICVEQFISKESVIRELPCGHIFHSDCIDEFLSEVSSLCPLCKASMMPPGYCPKITYAMVQREFATRKTHHQTGLGGPEPLKLGRPRLNSIFKNITSSRSLSQATTAVAESPKELHYP